MGQLSHFDVGALCGAFNLKVFVETGTGTGVSLKHAVDTGNFETLFSIEINPQLYRQAGNLFYCHDNVYVLEGASREVLPGVLRLISASDPVLFWLDAHFPGADYGLAGYGDEACDAVRMPLMAELELIRKHRLGARRDVILIDDARLLMPDGPYDAGVLAPEYFALVPDNMIGLEWVEEMWGDTHLLKIDWGDQGYLMLIPMGA